MPAPQSLPWTTVEVPAGLSVTDVAGDPNGRVWCIGAKEFWKPGCLLQIDAGRVAGLDVPPMTGLCTLRDGTVVACGDAGAWSLAGGAPTPLPPTPEPLCAIWGPARDHLIGGGRHGSLWMLHRDRWIRLETPEWTRVEELRLSLLDGLDDGTAWVVGNTLTASVTMRIEGGRVHADEGVSDLNVFVLGVAASDEVLVAGEHGVQRRSPTAQRNARGYVHWERTPLQLDGLDATAIATDAARVDDRWIVAGVTLGNFADGVPVGGSTPWLWNDGAQVPLPAPAMPYSTARLLSSSTLALGSRGRIHMVPLTALRV